MTDYKLLKNRVGFCCFSKTLYFYIALVLFGCSENPTEATATGEIPDDGTTPNPSFDLNASAARGQEIFNHVFKDSEGLGNERLPLWEVLNEWGADYEDPLIYVGDLYPNKSDPVNVITWQEMELIRAEAALNPDPGFGSGYSGDVNQFLVHINEVRDWHGLDPYTVDDALNYDNPDGGASTMIYIGVHYTM